MMSRNQNKNKLVLSTCGEKAAIALAGLAIADEIDEPSSASERYLRMIVG